GRISNVTFSDTPTPRFITFADATGSATAARFTNGTVTITDAAATSVEVSGRVLTPDGRGLRNATVTMVDANGKLRMATTGSFGFYRFENVTIGERQTLTVVLKRYRFTSKEIMIGDNLADVDFSAQE
ncbi:MAG: carboxypeptidase-like regulatory domain-containing protein, partial [Pyrinomonadaceae bacterium]